MKGVKVTQEMITMVANEWEEQHKCVMQSGGSVRLDPDAFDGKLTQSEIDETTEWLYSNN